MKLVKTAGIILTLFATLRALSQNVGIGTNTPLDKLEVNGKVRSNGLVITNANVIELGVGIPKQIDNGKIAYNEFGEANTLSLVGGGTAADGSDRRLKFWASGSEFTGGARFGGAVGIGTAPGLNQLTIMSSSVATLSLQNSNALNTGTATGIYFGGSNYTTASIQTIGNNSNSAKLAFFTGYSFTGGVSNLTERLTVANNGFTGINQTLPNATLDVGGSIRFSGSNPAAFVLTAQVGVNTYHNPFGIFQLTTSPTVIIDYVRIDHPHSNNNPNAIILATAIGEAVPANCTYVTSDGYWYISHYRNFSPNGSGLVCNSGCGGSSIDDPVMTISYYTIKPEDKYNLFVIRN